MSTKKAMVSKIKNGLCMIVTDDGQFKRIPLPRKPVQVGQIIDYKESNSLKWFKPLIMVASFLIVFIGLYAYQQSLPPGPLTYLTLDINPSIQLGLNSHDTVIEAIPLNSDGEKLLVKLAYKDKSYDVFLEDLVSEAANQGYLAKDEENVIVASLYNQNPTPQEQAQELKVRRSIGQSLGKKKIKADVLVYQVDKTVWQEAKKSGLSAGKLAFSKEMQAKGFAISNTELKKNSIKKILKQNLRQKQNILQKQTPTTPAEVTEVYQSENLPNVIPRPEVGQVNKDLQTKRPLKLPKPNPKSNQLNSRKTPPPKSLDPIVWETVYDEKTIPHKSKKPPQLKPERPLKKEIEKRNTKTNPQKPEN